MSKTKHALYSALEGSSRTAKAVNAAILIFIIGSVAVATLEVQLKSYLGDRTIKLFETVAISVFTVEYLVRIWTADWPRSQNPRIVHTWREGLICRLRAARQPLQLIDLLAILPFYVSAIVPAVDFSLAWVRIIRLFRIFRLFRLSRYSAALNSLGVVLRQRSRELLVLVFVVFVVLLIASNLLWEVEGPHVGVLPEDRNEGLRSIGDSIWWAVVTITSTGYGDVLPKTALGRVLAALLMILGVGFVAVPAGLVGASLLELMVNMKAERWKSDDYDQHVIICGWNKAGESIIREFTAVELDKVVIISRSDDVPLEIQQRYKVIHEDFTKDSVLRKVIFREGTWSHPCLIVLAEQRGDQTIEDVDARTLMTTMLAERIAREQNCRDDEDALYTITQMLESENARALRESVATANEVFVSGEVIGGMIANSVAVAGSSDILLELFSSAGENQLFSVGIGELPIWGAGGVRYEEVEKLCKAKSGLAIGFARVTIGQVKGTLNPSAGERLVSPRDIVYYVARRRLF